MKTRFVRYNHWPIFMKMTFGFSIMVSIVILISGLISFHVYRQSMEDQIRDFVPQVLLQANRQVENYVSDLVNLSQWVLTPSYYSSIYKAVSEINRSDSQPALQNTMAIQQFMESLKMRTSDSLRTFSLYTMNGLAYEFDQIGGSWTASSLAERDWYSKLDLINFSPLVLGTIQNPIIRAPETARNSLVFSIVQPIRRTATKDLIGALQVSGGLDTLKGIMAGIDFGPGSNLYIIDNQDMIVYSSAANMIGKPWKDNDYGIPSHQLQRMADSQMIEIEGRQFLTSYNWSAGTGWTVLAIIPMENFSKGISKISGWTALLIILGVVVAALLSIALSYGFTSRLRNLNRQVRSLQMDELRLDIDKVNFDEIGYLSHSFRQLVGRVRNLVEEVLTAKLLKQEAEIKALQSQINPHFLYNVLESIRMTVKQGELEQVEASLVSLGYVFRNQVIQAADSVLLREELEFLEQYLRIQKLRFGDKLEVEIDIQPGTGDVIIPRMILQPLVENALAHGRSPYDFTVQLTIRVNTTDGKLVMAIIDEGAGMSEDRLAEVLEGLKVGFVSDQRIGLANVYQRIKQIYKDEGNMSIDSWEGAGTVVALHIPLPDHPSDGMEGADSA
ncbi:sensor histidine kinase [Paenibacillus sp. GCM10027626]|uniref:cache domain-containing sensor histidine kinase n=1 Tax=Paenibacillus sp. GCM10027626 TaxID=3273411 RepID=UPI003642E362